MKKVREHIFGIIIAIFICMGACTVVFGKSLLVQGGLTSLFWAVAMFVFAYITMVKNQKELELFDAQSKAILIDIGVNGVNSDYYGVYDVTTLDKIRAKREKKLRKQVFGVFTIAVILIICAFICIF